jgi:hypothetical protein
MKIEGIRLSPKPLFGDFLHVKTRPDYRANGAEDSSPGQRSGFCADEKELTLWLWSRYAWVNSGN